MKTLLRSMIIIQHRDDEELFFRNYLKFVESGMGFDTPHDIKIWEFVELFCKTNNHSPDIKTVVSHFTREQDTDVLDRLDLLEGVDPITRGDFEMRVEEKVYFLRVRRTQLLLKEASTIVQTGLTVEENKQKRVLKGPRDAIRYIVENGHDIIKPTFGSRLSGEITSDGEDVIKEYDRVKNDPLAGIGQFTGIQQMDDALKGAKRHELWTHAAFTGGLKSTLMINWAYNQAVYYRHSSVIFSLEMPYHQVRRLLYTIHSYNDRFKEVRMELGLQTDPSEATGLPYQSLRDGQFNEVEEFFFKEFVVPDFNDPANEYGKIHIEVADPDKSDFTVTDLRSTAERIYSKSPFAMIFVDHMGLMSSRKWTSSTTDRLNEVIRDLKRLAMSFNRGQGMAVVGLFQISREGFKHAEKNNGLYNLTHLSYANECERSSDIVTTSFVNDDFREKSLVQYQNLKARDNKPFDLFFAKVDWPYRRIKTFQDIEMLDSEKDALNARVEEQLNAA